MKTHSLRPTGRRRGQGRASGVGFAHGEKGDVQLSQSPRVNATRGRPGGEHGCHLLARRVVVAEEEQSTRAVLFFRRASMTIPSDIM